MPNFGPLDKGEKDLTATNKEKEEGGDISKEKMNIREEMERLRDLGGSQEDKEEAREEEGGHEGEEGLEADRGEGEENKNENAGGDLEPSVNNEDKKEEEADGDRENRKYIIICWSIDLTLNFSNLFTLTEKEGELNLGEV